jgi:peptidyl-prolyl cis-trans isomerase D
MFDYVRKHTKIMMGLLFLLIIPSFVLFGIDGYKRFRERGQTVAIVDGHDISQGDWDSAHKMEVERLRAAMPSLDAKLLDSPQARYATLERLVRERVLAAAAESSRLTTSDARLARALQETPAIAALRRADGTLDMERYRQLVGSQGMTPEMFEARLRSDLSLRQVESGLLQTGFAAPATADLALRAFYDRREVQLARFNTADFAAKVNPSDADLEAFYQANQALFQAPEQASIEYIVLDLEAVKRSIRLNEQDLRSYYEQNAARLSGTEERRASHILIAAAKGAPDADRQKARARAEELLAQVRKTPDSFAELARKQSQDPGSAARGGDLDFFARGAMVKPFEDAVFALKKGEVSNVVESDFGYHIIKLTDIKTPKQKSFEELRASLEADLKNQQARTKYAEAAEAFANGVYEQSDSLKPVADKLRLDIRTAGPVRRDPTPGAQGVLANPKFLAAIFSQDAVANKRNSEAVETAPNQLAAGRITQYTPARTLPLSEVRTAVRERVVNARAAELARQEGEKQLAAWKTNPAQAQLQAAQVVSRDQPQNLPAPLLDAVLHADTASLPALVGADLGARGYAIARVNKQVERPAPAAAQQQQDRAQYTQWWTQAENQAYYRLLQERFKAQIKVPRPTGRDATVAAASEQ